MADISKVAKHSAECKTMGISVLPPSINDSEQYFTPTSQGIRFALGGIKGIGEGVVQTIIETRRKEGAFKGLSDFVQKIDVKKIGKKTIETLIEAGCFDDFSSSRRALIAQIGDLFDASVRIQREKTKGYLSFFEDGEQDPEATVALSSDEVPLERLFKERELLGFYLTGHPLQFYQDAIDTMEAATIDEVLLAQQSTVLIVPLVVEDLEFRLSQKTQKKFAVLKASDQSGMLELLAWSDIMETKGPLLKENSLLVALIEIEKKGAEQRTLLKDLYSFESVKIQEVLENRDRLRASQKSFLQKKAQQESRGNVMKGKEEKKEPLLKLQLNEAEMGHQAVVHLKKLFSNSAGKSPVRIRIGPTTLQIDESFGVKITPELLNELKTLKYVETVEHGEG